MDKLLKYWKEYQEWLHTGEDLYRVDMKMLTGDFKGFMVWFEYQASLPSEKGTNE